MVRRVYVEKKEAVAEKAHELKGELKSYLSLKELEKVRVLIRYDIENISEETYKKALGIVFSEPPVDDLYEGDFPKNAGDFCFSVEYLPGQFDQRADSAEQCVKLLDAGQEPVIRSATTYVLSGSFSADEKEAIKAYCINPVDSRETDETLPETLVTKYEDPADVAVFDGFTAYGEEELKKLYDSLNLAMTFKDFRFIQEYFAGEEKRDPSMTEIRVLDTYWSDHCRHTTFQTELTNVTFEDGFYRKPIEDSYNRYLAAHKELYKGRDDKYVCLMDVALLAMKELKKAGKLADMEESDEINACSIIVPIDIEKEDGSKTTEEWLVFFKNETHNHPTEIEPFGGAATCLGGAIRDPLSGRGYVYQAMRVTGAADPTKSLKETLLGKLPQRKICTGAAKGYSSYGNQIGLATGLVDEVYHPNYVAKRLEIGAVMGAAPRKNVKRETSDPGDIIILLGGRTGRDGCGGATGSSKAHTTSSIDTCGAEVQKGNAPTERKIQRLFRRAEVSRLIKKCNDFGAGGVSVAIGELADGLRIYLDRVPKKYAGLDGTELAISESQERMAIVVDPKDVDEMMKYAGEENLEAVVAAEVTEDPRLVMLWRDKEIVNISRKFLNTNGAHQEMTAVITMPDEKAPYVSKCDKVDDVKTKWLETLADLNVCSKKGLVEMFDSSIGAATVTMPYGGKYQSTPIQTMTCKLPVDGGESDTVTMMSYGFDPYLSSWSPYHGAMYAVVNSVAKIVAAGGDHKKIRFTFQEFFKRLKEDPKRWGDPLKALLGAYEAQLRFGLPSIGGKDSMSGSFNEIDVPPTLVSFAVDTAKTKDVISPEFKKAGNEIYLFDIEKDEYGLPVFDKMQAMYERIHELITEGKIVSAFALGGYGVAEGVAKMAFGNDLGAEVSLSAEELFAARYGAIIVEANCSLNDGVKAGKVIAESSLKAAGACISLKEAYECYTKTLEKVYPTKTEEAQCPYEDKVFDAKTVYTAKNKVARPKVFIPVFPGTNCEYDSAKAFKKAGADVVSVVFRNLTASDIELSVKEYVKAINESQMIMFPGGFSAGDEPDGSAKFIASAFRNPEIAEAVNRLLKERDGLALGICNGFQALVKLGLVTYGEITNITADSPTLTTNTIGRHQSKSVYTKVVTNKSPWLMKAELGKVYSIPASHGEGRFVANKEWLDKLFANGQVATRYVDADGKPTMDVNYNINGSYAAIEGITSPDGRVLGKMAHSERIGKSVAINICGEQDQHIFESGVAYYK
jgi:phosphoribosylformylglycinamidine synthase